MAEYLKSLIDHIVKQSSSPQQLIRAVTLGVFLACSPLLGVQTIVALGLSWFLNINVPVVLIVLYAVNNPFTMIPIILLCYLVGHVLFATILRLPLDRFHLPCLGWLEDYMMPFIAPKIAPLTFSLNYYIIGGFILAGVCALICYLILVQVCRQCKPFPPRLS